MRLKGMMERLVWVMRIASILIPLLLGAIAVSEPSSAASGKAFDTLLGTWSGVGKINLEGGRSERVRCNAYYTGGDAELRLAIRCASAGYNIKIRSVLRREGSKLYGTWEERNYNASGKVMGRLIAHRINLSISGGGLSGSMSIAYAASSQFVAISAKGTELKSVQISFFRD